MPEQEQVKKPRNADPAELSLPRSPRIAVESIGVEDVLPSEARSQYGTKYVVKLDREGSINDPLVSGLSELAAKLQPALGPDQRVSPGAPATPQYDPKTKEATYILYGARIRVEDQILDKPREIPPFSAIKFLKQPFDGDLATVMIIPHPRAATGVNPSSAFNREKQQRVARALEDYVAKSIDPFDPPKMSSAYDHIGDKYFLSIRLKDSVE